MAEQTKILLLDSNSLVNRAFHALPPLITNDGLYTNAIYGYMTMLYKLITDERPTHICAVFDCRAKTFRHSMYDKYKATRKPMPEELAVQVPVLQDLLNRIGIKILFKEGYEADDILGTLAKRFDLPTIIVSGDRDTLQLVDNTTTVFHTKRGITEVKKYTPPTLLEEGFTPAQIIDFKALAGDSSDNIPGCPGVGQKTATDLLSQHQSVEGIYKNIDTLNGKLKEKLIANKEIVFLSKKLATIDVNADVECNLEELKFNYEIDDTAKTMMQYLRFKSLTDRFCALSVKKNSSELNFKAENETEPNLIRMGNHIVSFIKVETQTTQVRDEEGLKKIIGLLQAEKKIFVDITEEKIILASYTNVYEIIISQNLLNDGLYVDTAMDNIKVIIDSDQCSKIFYDAKRSFHCLARFNIKPCNAFEDIQLMAYLINNTKVIKNKEQLLGDYSFELDNPNGAMLALYDLLLNKIEEKNLTKLYREIELPLVNILFEMEKTGFSVNTTILNELGEKYSIEINALLDEIYLLAGEIFNVNSNKQLAEVLFEKIGLKHAKKTKTGYSVDAETLEELEHPIVTAILRYRELSKLKSTYIEGMRSLINPSTGKVHTCFNQCITATGRLSSTEPNLQNIPIRKNEGREIRKMFVPTEGHKLVTADYSQIELRLLAHFSEEERLIEAYKNGEDIHRLTASEIFNIPVNMVTSEMRSSAKAVNFGIIYGISSFGLSKNAGVSRKQAKSFIEQYFEKYPKVKTYMNNNVELAKKQGYLTTLFGRIRYFPELTSSKHNIRAFGERAAMNMPLQGTASDIIKIAMLKVSDMLRSKRLNAKLILQVHDELIIDAPEAEVEEVKQILKEGMETAVKLSVPLTVNVASGSNWYESK